MLDQIGIENIRLELDTFPDSDEFGYYEDKWKEKSKKWRKTDTRSKRR
jgi:hypothetical protein